MNSRKLHKSLIEHSRKIKMMNYSFAPIFTTCILRALLFISTSSDSNFRLTSLRWSRDSRLRPHLALVPHLVPRLVPTLATGGATRILPGEWILVPSQLPRESWGTMDFNTEEPFCKLISGLTRMEQVLRHKQSYKCHESNVLYKLMFVPIVLTNVLWILMSHIIDMWFECVL